MGDFASIIGDSFDTWREAANEKVSEATGEGVATVVQLVAAKARELCPVDTGTLKDTIEGVHVDGSHYGIVKTDAAKAWYGFLVHWGTVKMPGRPFLYQAAETSHQDLVTEIGKNI